MWLRSRLFSKNVKKNFCGLSNVNLIILGFWLISPTIKPFHFSSWPHSGIAFHWQESLHSIEHPQQLLILPQYLLHSDRAIEAFSIASLGNENFFNTLSFLLLHLTPLFDLIKSCSGSKKIHVRFKRRKT